MITLKGFLKGKNDSILTILMQRQFISCTVSVCMRMYKYFHNYNVDSFYDFLISKSYC